MESTYYQARQINCHEDEICLTSDVIDTYRPCLGRNNAPNWATWSSEVEAASSVRGWEKFGSINPGGRSEAERVPKRVEKYEDDAGIIGGVVTMVWVAEGEGTIELEKNEVSFYYPLYSQHQLEPNET